MNSNNLFTRNLHGLAAGLALATVTMAVSSVALAGGDVEKGKQLSQTCAGCHGADGNSAVPTNPILAGQYESYLVRALSDYQSGARNNAIMSGFAAALSEQDIRDLAAYFAAQESVLSVPGS